MILELPYAGTSGWSGSETSAARARGDDKDGTTSRRQTQARSRIFEAGVEGLTWKELADQLNLHHGQASGVLSVLHKTGHIVRLAETRNRCAVYVNPQFVNGRDIRQPQRKACPHCGGHL